MSLGTARVAELVGIDRHDLAAAVTKLWWFYLRDQPETVGSGASRSFEPVDVVVVAMLADTTGLGGEVISEVRDSYADSIYEAHDRWYTPLGPGSAVELAAQLDVPRWLAATWSTLGHTSGPVTITYTPRWRLLDAAQVTPSGVPA